MRDLDWDDSSASQMAACSVAEKVGGLDAPRAAKMVAGWAGDLAAMRGTWWAAKSGRLQVGQMDDPRAFRLVCYTAVR